VARRRQPNGAIAWHRARCRMHSARIGRRRRRFHRPQRRSGLTIAWTGLPVGEALLAHDHCRPIATTDDRDDAGPRARRAWSGTTNGSRAIAGACLAPGQQNRVPAKGFLVRTAKWRLTTAKWRATIAKWRVASRESRVAVGKSRISIASFRIPPTEFRVMRASKRVPPKRAASHRRRGAGQARNERTRSREPL
jgi:hypothetical protein